MKDRLKRAGWLFLVVLFVLTGLGIGVWGFLDATRQSPTDELSQQAANDCAFTSIQGVETLKNPEAFKPKADVTTLSVTDLQKGSGKTVQAGDCITAKYYGTLAADGQEFDGNFNTPEAIQFTVGQGQVIAGWDQGLLGMNVGGIRRLVIPSELAYGDQGNEVIPANSDLVFVVKVLDAK